MGIRLDHAKSLYLEGIRDGHPRDAIAAHTGDRYTQHSTGVADGQEGFIAFFEPFIAKNPKRDIRIVRGLEDGQHVFVHAYQSLNDGEAEWVTMDFFDTDDDGKIVEHWDVIAPFAPKTPSGHTSIDGPTEVDDLEQTEANKAVVRDLITRSLIGRDVSAIREFISEDYVQHNAQVADGRDAFEKLASDPDRPLDYQEIFLLVGQGNFVATLCKSTWQGKPMCQADLFRLEGSKIVEHWDNVEPVPPKEEWANGGKF